MTQYSIVSYSSDLAKKDFICGDATLDAYFSHYAGQDEKRNVARCYVLLSAKKDVAGYYTLSSGSVSLGEIPDVVRKKLPRYPTVPVVRMGRLAVALKFQGQGLGGVLLINAIKRILNSGIGCYALFVEAKNPQAVDFYKHFGFIPLKDDTRHLFFPVASMKI